MAMLLDSMAVIIQTLRNASRCLIITWVQRKLFKICWEGSEGFLKNLGFQYWELFVVFKRKALIYNIKVIL